MCVSGFFSVADQLDDQRPEGDAVERNDKVVGEMAHVAAENAFVNIHDGILLMIGIHVAAE